MLPNRTAPLPRGQLSSRLGTLGNPQQRLKGQISQHNNFEHEENENTSGYSGQYFEEQQSSLEDSNEGYLRNEMRRENSKRFLASNQIKEEGGKQPTKAYVHSSKQTENRSKEFSSEETQILRRRGLRDQQEFQEEAQYQEDINRSTTNYQSSTANNTNMSGQLHDKKMLAIITLQIGDGNDQIVVNQGDDISDLSQQFCQKHSLEPEWESQITQIISENLQKKLQSRNQRKINGSQMQQSDDGNTQNSQHNPNDNSYHKEKSYQAVSEPSKVKSNINNAAKSSNNLSCQDERPLENHHGNFNSSNKITFYQKQMNPEWNDEQRYYQQQHSNERKNSESPKFPSVPQISEPEHNISLQKAAQEYHLQSKQNSNTINKRRQQQPSFGEMHFFEVSNGNNQDDGEEQQCEQIAEGEESSEESSLHQTNTTAGGGHSINQSSFYDNNIEQQQQYAYYRENSEQTNDKKSNYSKPNQQLNTNQPSNKAFSSNNNQNNSNRSFIDGLNHKAMDNKNRNGFNQSALEDDYVVNNPTNKPTAPMTSRKIQDSSVQSTQRDQYQERQEYFKERISQINQNTNRHHQDNSNYKNDNSYAESDENDDADERAHSVHKQAVLVDVANRTNGKIPNEIINYNQQFQTSAQSSQYPNDSSMSLSDPNHRKNIAQLIAKNLHIGNNNNNHSTQQIPSSHLPEKANILPSKSQHLSQQCSNPKQSKPQSRQQQSQQLLTEQINNSHLDSYCSSSAAAAETNATSKQSQSTVHGQVNDAEKSYDVWMKLLNQKITSTSANTMRQQTKHYPNQPSFTPTKVNQLLGSPLRNQSKNQSHSQNIKNVPDTSAMNSQTPNNRNSQVSLKQSNPPGITTTTPNKNSHLKGTSAHQQNYSTQSAQTHLDTSQQQQYQDLSPRALSKNKSSQMLRTPNSNHLASPQASTHRSRAAHGGGSKERTSPSPSSSSSKHVGLKADESKAIMFQQAQIHRDQLKVFLDTKAINSKEVRGSSTSRNNPTSDKRELTPRRVVQQPRLDEQRSQQQQLIVPMSNIRNTQNISNNSSFINNSSTASSKMIIGQQHNRQSTPTRQLKTLVDSNIQLSPSGKQAPLSSRNCLTPTKDSQRLQGTLSHTSKQQQQQLRPSSKDKTKSTALSINSNIHRNPNPEPITPRRQQANNGSISNNNNNNNNQRTPNKELFVQQYQPQKQSNNAQKQQNQQQQTSQQIIPGSLKGKINPSLQRKLGQLFSQFDSDNDGLISSIEIDISSTDAELLVIIQNALYEIEEHSLTLNVTQFISLLQQHNLIPQLQQYYAELEGEDLCEVDAMLAEMNKTNRCTAEDQNGFKGRVDEGNYQKMSMNLQGNQNTNNLMKNKSNMRGNLIENKENSYNYEDISQNLSYSNNNNNNRIQDNNARMPQQRHVQQQQQHVINKYSPGYY